MKKLIEPKKDRIIEPNKDRIKGITLTNISSVNTCAAPVIAQGTVDPATATVNFEATYSVTCDERYTASSEDVMTCQANGTLDVEHTCDSKYSN